MQTFFKLIETRENVIKYSIKKPSRILLQNIYSNWLQSLCNKTHKNIKVYLLNNSQDNIKDKIPYGFLNQNKPDFNDSKILEFNVNDIAPKHGFELKFNLMVPEEDVMQYFIQWQRYRKYWWSSITTTPSLFSISDIKYWDKRAEVNIIAKFPWGEEIVETVNIKSQFNDIKTISALCCSMSLQNALFTLLLDGLTSTTKEGFLRLHRIMAPYKISFAFDEGSHKKDILNELATLLHQRLQENTISAWLPNFSMPMESQIKSSLQMGVAYTAILSEKTLENGIFHLLNSSTMLKEQVHISDFVSYAARLCRTSLNN